MPSETNNNNLIEIRKISLTIGLIVNHVVVLEILNYINLLFQTNFTLTSDDPRSYIFFNDKQHPEFDIKLIAIKSNDVNMLLNNDFINGVICFNNKIEEENFNLIKYETLTKPNSKIAVISKQDFNLDKNRKIVIFSEYLALTYKYIRENNINAKILETKGKSESYLINGLCDLCVCAVETGNTIKANNCVIFSVLLESEICLYFQTEIFTKIRTKI